MWIASVLQGSPSPHKGSLRGWGGGESDHGQVVGNDRLRGLDRRNTSPRATGPSAYAKAQCSRRQSAGGPPIAPTEASRVRVTETSSARHRSAASSPAQGCEVQRPAGSAGAQSAICRKPAEVRPIRPVLFRLADRIATRLRTKCRPGRTNRDGPRSIRLGCDRRQLGSAGYCSFQVGRVSQIRRTGLVTRPGSGPCAPATWV